MARIPDGELERLKAEISVERLVEASGIALTKSNKGRLGKCPFRFITWCDERGITMAVQLDRGILERYQRHLFHWRKADGEPLSTGSQQGRITPIRHCHRLTMPANSARSLPSCSKVTMRRPISPASPSASTAPAHGAWLRG